MFNIWYLFELDKKKKEKIRSIKKNVVRHGCSFFIVEFIFYILQEFILDWRMEYGLRQCRI